MSARPPIDKADVIGLANECAAACAALFRQRGWPAPVVVIGVSDGFDGKPYALGVCVEGHTPAPRSAA